ncbi:hypothetical protein TW83_14725 [Paracoccus sp. S4493]|nr:hypothetical protein TW83_14725 [Paracoccus sp. S4493]
MTDGVGLGRGERPNIETQASEHVLHLVDAQAALAQLGCDLGEIGGADHCHGQGFQNALATRLAIQKTKKR